MNYQPLIDGMKKNEADRKEIRAEIGRLIAERDEQLASLAGREQDNEQRLLKEIERMKEDFRREGEWLAKEREHFVNILRKLDGEMPEQLAPPADDQQVVLQISDQRGKKRRRWI